MNRLAILLLLATACSSVSVDELCDRVCLPLEDGGCFYVAGKTTVDDADVTSCRGRCEGEPQYQAAECRAQHLEYQDCLIANKQGASCGSSGMCHADCLESELRGQPGDGMEGWCTWSTRIKPIGVGPECF